MSVLGIIGVGELALYTVKGLRRGGYAGRILLSPRNRANAAYLEQNCACEIGRDNQAVAAAADYVLLATRPADCFSALHGLRLNPGQVLISVVAGITIERLREVIAADVDIVRAMPVSSAEVGASPTLVYPAQDFVCALFDHCGNSIAIKQERFFDQGTILACVYSWYFALFDTLTNATEGPDLPAELSARLVMGMARGAAELALAKPRQTPLEIADAIATDGTYSRLGLDLLQQQNAFDAWHDACKLLQQQLARG